MGNRAAPSREAALMLLDAVVKWEHAAIRALFILNGGALVAALAFAGNSASKGSAHLTAALVLPMRLWIIGVTLAALVAITAYFSQQAFYKREGRRLEGKDEEADAEGKRGVDIRNLAFACGLGSIISFVVGAWMASTVFGADFSGEIAESEPQSEISK